MEGLGPGENDGGVASFGFTGGGPLLVSTETESVGGASPGVPTQSQEDGAR